LEIEGSGDVPRQGTACGPPACCRTVPV